MRRWHRQTWSASGRGYVETETNHLVTGLVAALLAVAIIVILFRGF